MAADRQLTREGDALAGIISQSAQPAQRRLADEPRVLAEHRHAASRPLRPRPSRPPRGTGARLCSPSSRITTLWLSRTASARVLRRVGWPRRGGWTAPRLRSIRSIQNSGSRRKPRLKILWFCAVCPWAALVSCLYADAYPGGGRAPCWSRRPAWTRSGTRRRTSRARSASRRCTWLSLCARAAGASAGGWCFLCARPRIAALLSHLCDLFARGAITTASARRSGKPPSRHTRTVRSENVRVVLGLERQFRCRADQALRRAGRTPVNLLARAGTYRTHRRMRSSNPTMNVRRPEPADSLAGRLIAPWRKIWAYRICTRIHKHDEARG